MMRLNCIQVYINDDYILFTYYLDLVRAIKLN